MTATYIAQIKARDILIALAITSIASLLRVWPLQTLGTQLAWLTYYPAVVLAALYFGIYSGVLTVFFSSLTVALVWPQITNQSFLQNEMGWIGLITFTLTGLTICWVVHVSIEERKKTKDALDAANIANLNLQRMAQKLTQFSAIIESSEDAILSKTLDGVITSWNGGAQKLFQYDSEEIIGHSVSVLIPEEYRNEE